MAYNSRPRSGSDSAVHSLARHRPAAAPLTPLPTNLLSRIARLPERDPDVVRVRGELLRIGTVSEVLTAQEKWAELKAIFWRVSKASYIAGSSSNVHRDVRDFPQWALVHFPEEQLDIILRAVYGRKERELAGKARDAFLRVARAANLTPSLMFLFLGEAICQNALALTKISALLKSRAKVKLEPADVVRGLWEIVLTNEGHKDNFPEPAAKHVSLLTDHLKDRPANPAYKPRGKRGEKRKQPEVEEDEDDDDGDSEEETVERPAKRAKRTAAKATRGAAATAADAAAEGGEEQSGLFQMEDFDYDAADDDHYAQRAALDAAVQENLRDDDSAEAGPSSRRESGIETGRGHTDEGEGLDVSSPFISSPASEAGLPDGFDEAVALIARTPVPDKDHASELVRSAHVAMKAGVRHFIEAARYERQARLIFGPEKGKGKATD